jgi:NTE family protein
MTNTVSGEHHEIDTAQLGLRWEREGRTEKLGLCLSGGGYRAMLFHLGSLWRLNECRLLHSLDRVSSVSGGSIVAGVLGSRWNTLQFEDEVARNFASEIVRPIQRLASTTIDIPVALQRLVGLRIFRDPLAAYYNKLLFRGRTLQDLPDRPNFVFNATNLQSRSLWRYTKSYTWHYGAGLAQSLPTDELAVVVAASSSFPPFLSPLRKKLKRDDWKPTGDAAQAFLPWVVLSDGGIYDNLGLEVLLQRSQTILVSDGGATIRPKNNVLGFWPTQLYRVLQIIDNQVRTLRGRQFVSAVNSGSIAGAYWSIRTDISSYNVPGTLPFSAKETERLASIKTRLAALSPKTQMRLINWGYAVSDAALRSQKLGETFVAPVDVPFPRLVPRSCLD